MSNISWSSVKISCPICSEIINQGNKARHIRTYHSNDEIPFKGIIKEGHSENENEENEEPENLKYNEIPVYINRNIPVLNNSAINDIKSISDTVNNIINKVKMLEETQRADNEDIYKLKSSNNILVQDVRAIKKHLTEQLRGVNNIRHEYNHGSSTNKDKINKLIKEKAHSNSNNVLSSLKIIIETMKDSISRSETRLNNLNDRLDKIEARQEAIDIKMNSVISVNKQLESSIERHENKINKLDDKFNTIEDKMSSIPTAKQIIDMMKELLTKEGYDINKIVKDKVGGSKKVKVDKPLQVDKPQDDTDKPLKENDFELDSKQWLDNVRLRNGVITKKGLIELKKIFNKYASMGHLNEMMDYIEKLPNKVTRGPVNLKKVETKKALLLFKKNYEVK